MLNVMCHEIIQKINQETLVSYDLESVISHCSWQLESLMWPMHGVGPVVGVASGYSFCPPCYFDML